MAPADLTNVLPPLYARWLSTSLSAAIPDETASTCNDCAMVRNPGVSVTTTDGRRRVGEPYAFRPDMKCCSTVPILPNYLVGGVLADTDPALEEGRASVRARIAFGAAVTPLGLGQTEAFHRHYSATAPTGFGRDPSLRCPHYLDANGGRCGIWRHRNGVCSTYFCKPRRGRIGADFWRGGLRPLLGAVEKALSRWCVLQLDPGGRSLEALFNFHQSTHHAGHSEGTNATGAVDPELHRQLWGNLHGREEEYFRSCATRVEALSWNQVREIGGAEVQLLEETARRHHQALLAQELPPRIKLGEFAPLRGSSASMMRLLSYDTFDVPEVPTSVIALLPLLDGKETPVALKLAEERGVPLSPALLLQLIDYGALKPALL